MKIAITGGSGSIGRAVIDLALAQGHSVVNLDRVALADAPPGVVCIQADLSDYAAVERAFAGCDTLIHLGAIPAPGRHPDHLLHHNNVVGSYNAMRAAVAVGITRICQASSVNAIGHSYSRAPHYDYFPLDEAHPTYNEDPYSLSKWICEQQADSLVRRYSDLQIASLRMHWVVPDRAFARGHYPSIQGQTDPRHLWAWVHTAAAARACLLSLTADLTGHETFFIVAPETLADEIPSLDLARRYYPAVPIRGDLSGQRGFFSCAKAEALLGWRHDEG